jgi:hypothetical protein
MILTSLAAIGCLTAADKPNLTGTWNIDLEKSDFGMMPPPTKLERKVDHKDPEFSVTTLQANARGERTTEAKMTTDGKECEIQIMGRPAKAKAVWEGKSIVVNTKAEFQGTEVLQVEKWTLSEDGKTLTTEASLNSPMGENKSKLVFKKAE